MCARLYLTKSLVQAVAQRIKLTGLSGYYPLVIPRPEGVFRAGNQEALKERLTPEAHSKRMQALFKGWTTKARLSNGENFVPKNQKRKEAKRVRRRLYSTVAREAR